MNNDRVRIYELSKELNLDNKELLAICNQLSIAVKSHSSTVRETDAERIRAATEKRTVIAGFSGRESVAAQAPPKPHLSHKQQILEIRKPKTSERNNSKESRIATRSSQSPIDSLQAPRPYPPSVSPMKPMTPTQSSTHRSETPVVKADDAGTPQANEESEIALKAKAISELAQPPVRPIPPVAPTPELTQSEQPELERDRVDQRVDQLGETATETTAKKSARSRNVAPSSEQANVKTPPGASLQAQSMPELRRPKPAHPVEPETLLVATAPKHTGEALELKVVEEKHSETASETKAVLEKPQRVKPPMRAVSSVALTPEVSQEEQSAKKRDWVKPKGNKPVETATETAAKKPARPAKVASASEQEAPKAKPMLELRRPKPTHPVKPETPSVALLPKPALVTAKSEVVEEEQQEVFNEPEELLERPKLPRPVKVGNKRQEEEIDEGQDSKAKSGKAGIKVKRAKPILDIDEEEVWDDTELDLDAPIQANLAVARPAKPKASPTKSPVMAALTATAAKTKKSTSSRDRNRHHESEPKRERPDRLVVTGSMTVQELAEALAAQDTEIVKILFLKGMAVSITQSLDIPTLTLVGKELGVQLDTAQPEEQARKVTEMLDVEDLENLQRRPPVVTIMGHVDHGKTSLLDAIRHTKVAQGEAGGITQHIGAYHVNVENDGQDQKVVFLDTPGHEAFTAMRARGTRVTDIAILVVAADDGVQPQTVEAISHAKAAEVPIVVAINKIDKPEAQPDRVKQELTEYGLVSEEWGGDTIMVPVSAIQRENLDTLLEMILLVAEISDLQANPDRAAKGTVIEANLDKTRGSVATLLVQNGTLRVGNILVAGSAFGKVRAMVDDRGQRVEAATPSFAVEVLGLSEVPAAGDEFEVFQSEKEARAIATQRAEKQRQSRLMQGRISLATLSAQAQEGALKELNLILKADVQGSVEAIVGALKQLPQTEVQLRLLLAAPGEVTETDIDLAAASGAVIVGFNTTLASGARQAADEAGVDVREYNIIYKLLEDIQGAMEGLLEPELVEEALGQVEVRAVFSIGHNKVAGCYVQSGKVIRNCKLRVHRGGKVIYEGTLDSLKRMKEDAREVNAGYECGIGVNKFNDWTEGDIIETFQMVTKRRTLSTAK
ncbi:MAG: translation initiation factor IF-2 [Coleofasciculus sp. S288]|nr:translation initiation factor IF-2 [Coleofasciculus sp. S288]